MKNFELKLKVCFVGGIICAVLLLISVSLFGVYNNGMHKSENEKEVPYKLTNSDLAMVLKNEKKLVCIQTGEEMYLNEYKYNDFMTVNEDGKYVYDSSQPEVIDNFCVDSISVVDIDSDGSDEVVLYEKNYGNRIIIRSFGGNVYLYSFPFRQMKNIYNNGEFVGSSSAVTTYMGKLKFEGQNCFYSQTCLLDQLQEKGSKYIVNNKKVSKKEAEKYLLEKSEDTVKQYEFTLRKQ